MINFPLLNGMRPLWSESALRTELMATAADAEFMGISALSILIKATEHNVPVFEKTWNWQNEIKQPPIYGVQCAFWSDAYQNILQAYAEDCRGDYSTEDAYVLTMIEGTEWDYIPGPLQFGHKGTLTKQWSQAWMTHDNDEMFTDVRQAAPFRVTSSFEDVWFDDLTKEGIIMIDLSVGEDRKFAVYRYLHWGNFKRQLKEAQYA